MSIGSWSSPLLGIGGGHDERCETVYDALLAEWGRGAFATADTTSQGSEAVATARLLAAADSLVDLRLAQSDPVTMTVAVESWERVLGLVPGSADTDYTRRCRIASRISGYFSALAGAVSSIAENSFSPWTVQLHFNSTATAKVLWPAGTHTTDDDWYSTVALVCVEYLRPATASDADVETRRQTCADALEEYLPAWAVYSLSETPDGSTYGFRVGVSRLGYTALSSV